MGDESWGKALCMSASYSDGLWKQHSGPWTILSICHARWHGQHTGCRVKLYWNWNWPFQFLFSTVGFVSLVTDFCSMAVIRCSALQSPGPCLRCVYEEQEMWNCIVYMLFFLLMIRVTGTSVANSWMVTQGKCLYLCLHFQCFYIKGFFSIYESSILLILQCLCWHSHLKSTPLRATFSESYFKLYLFSFPLDLSYIWCGSPQNH